MAAYPYRSGYRGAPYRRPRPRYRRRGSGNTGLGLVVVAVAVFAAAGKAAATAAPPGHHHTAPAAVQPAQVTTVAAGTSETAFIAAVLADLGAPDTAADQQSMASWGAREGCWGCVGRYNQWDSTLYEPGATAFNTFDGDLHVWNYPTPATGARATAQTISTGYPLITAALVAGGGLCRNGTCPGGLAYEFGRWSGGGYQGA